MRLVQPPCAARRGQGRQLTSVDDSNGVRCVRERNTVVLGGAHGGWRGVDDGHGREVLGLGVAGVIVVVVVEWDSGRGLWGAALGHVDDKSLIDCLAAWEVVVEGAAHLLLWAQRAFVDAAGISRHYSQGHVGGVEAAAERVGVLLEDHVAHIVDEIILADLHQRGRGMQPLHPHLAVQHLSGGRSRKDRNIRCRRCSDWWLDWSGRLEGECRRRRAGDGSG